MEFRQKLMLTVPRVCTLNSSSLPERFPSSPCFVLLNLQILFYDYENNQQDALYILIHYSKSALREHLTVVTVSGSVHPSCCRLGSHSEHQPAANWVNNSRYCNYSQVLLMMGENIARNM